MGMIVLDTNVVSEAMKPEPHPAVQTWLDAPDRAARSLSSARRRSVSAPPR